MSASSSQISGASTGRSAGSERLSIGSRCCSVIEAPPIVAVNPERAFSSAIAFNGLLCLTRNGLLLRLSMEDHCGNKSIEHSFSGNVTPITYAQRSGGRIDAVAYVFNCEVSAGNDG